MHSQNRQITTQTLFVQQCENHLRGGTLQYGQKKHPQVSQELIRFHRVPHLQQKI